MRDAKARLSELLDTCVREGAQAMSRTYKFLAMNGPASRFLARTISSRFKSLYEAAMIAATTRIHNLTVVTRSMPDLRFFRVKLLDPFFSAEFDVDYKNAAAWGRVDASRLLRDRNGR